MFAHSHTATYSWQLAWIELSSYNLMLLWPITSHEITTFQSSVSLFMCVQFNNTSNIFLSLLQAVKLCN